MSAEPMGSLYAFPSDLLDEGASNVLRASERLGMARLSIAVAYHQARDVTPHAGAKPRLRYRRDGVFFEPDPDVWDGLLLRPRLQPSDEREALAELLDRSTGNVEAWTVFLHNSSLGEEHPEVATLTCFGDRIVSNLCPSNPNVVAYSLALARDIASRGLDIVAEALSAQTFGHGSHHERSFAPISVGAEALLGLCFCEHCTTRAAALGADVASLRRRVGEYVQDAWAARVPFLEATRIALANAVGDDVLLLLAARESAVTELTRAVAEAVHAQGRSLSLMDLTGAVLGYDNGLPEGALAAEQSWRIAIDPEAASAHADSYSILGYVRDRQRLHDDVASYVRVLGGTPLRVILRPGFPDTESLEHLTAKVEACLEAGASAVDFYNYGMYDQSVLDRIPGVKKAIVGP
jgi:hypothetical protein